MKLGEPGIASQQLLRKKTVAKGWRNKAVHFQAAVKALHSQLTLKNN